LKNGLTAILNIEYPIIMAPMFLVSNTKMIIAGLEAGITGAIPALNYRKSDDLRKAILTIREASDKPFGVNLIVNRSNPKVKQQLKVLLETRVDYIITSLGNPKKVIDECKPLGIKVFCDVVNLKQAQKVEQLGADAVIAVCNRTGGHLGKMGKKELVEEIQANCNIPVIAAGGIFDNKSYKETMELGVAGVSVGTAFIASEECSVSQQYKQALIDYGANDIVITNKMSGSPLTVINTPYVQEIGLKANWLEFVINRVKFLKKIVKTITVMRAMKVIERSAFKASYKNVWVAGYSIEGIKSIRLVKEIVSSITNYRISEQSEISQLQISSEKLAAS